MTTVPYKVNVTFDTAKRIGLATALELLDVQGGAAVRRPSDPTEGGTP